MSDSKTLKGSILGLGNPLLDISADVDQSYLDKYGLTMNNAILAEEKHLPMYQEMVDNLKVTYVAGGATQNSIRVCQWMLNSPGACSFIGSVGSDKFGEALKSAAEGDKVSTYYSQDAKTPTGTCAVLIKDKERSLVANLSAANNYKIDHIKTKEIAAVLDAAQYIYMAGFFLTVSPETIQYVAKHSLENKKTLIMNLSAPFITQFFEKPLLAAMPYVDYIFGNESEAEAFGKQQKYEDTSVKAVALKLQALPRENKERPRIVVITQGAGSTVVVSGDGKVTEYETPKLEANYIVDVNGAGDAFVGGFLSQLVQGKDTAACVKAGNYAAGVILGVSGTVLNGTSDSSYNA